MMLAHFLDPSETYRRVELDARIEGADGIGLTRLCLERTIDELRLARSAFQHGNQPALREALTRASSGIFALSTGVDDGNPLREPLLHLYGSASNAVKSALTRYRQDVIDRVREDLQDILAIL